MQRLRVDVDSGVIQIARNPDHLQAGSDLYGKIQDLALWTAEGVWDGRKGSIGTPHGDGPHDVIYDQKRPYKHKEWDGKPHAFLVNLPRDQKAKAFTLFLGDAGRVDAVIDFPEHSLIAFGWTDGNTLVFVSE